jgi:hypothetical protein
MNSSGTTLNSNRIMQVGMGFWASKTLLAAVKLNLFTHLSKEPMTAEQVKNKLGLNKKGLYVRDFLDALVSMNFLEREGSGESATYRNSAETGAFLVKDTPGYLGGFLEMANDREYKFWGDLEEGLLTGEPQNEIKYTGKSSFEAIYASPEALRNFAQAMGALQMENFQAFVDRFDFSPYRTLHDFGGSSGIFSALVARKNPHMRCTTFDLPGLVPDRVTARGLDFFAEELPGADVISMNNVLNSFDMSLKRMLIEKAARALKEGGVYIAIENFIDNDRRHNTFGLLMSLNMLIESDGGFCHTEAEFADWLKESGFRKVEFLPLNPITSAAIAYR